MQVLGIGSVFGALILGIARNPSLKDRCFYTVNKKRYGKFTTFSRHVFLKIIRAGPYIRFTKI